MRMSPQDFINKVLPEAKELSGIPVAFTIAQAAVESTWGNSQLCQKANALFGIKATKSWHGKTINMPTDEFIKGKLVKVDALWRAYDSWEDSIIDHAVFLKTNKRYAKALEFSNDPSRFAIEVANAGYSTNPNYANLINSIIRQRGLDKL